MFKWKLVSLHSLYFLYVFISSASTEVRSPRPPFVFLRVGEVVLERKGHMVGVVVSWDPELRAPPEWIKRIYSGLEVSSWNVYSPPLHDVLFDTHFVEYLKLSQFKEFCECVCVCAGYHSREDTPLQGTVQWTWSHLSASCIFASDTTGAHHWDEGKHWKRRTGNLQHIHAQSDTPALSWTHCWMFPAGHPHLGELLHTFWWRAVHHAAVAQRDLPWRRGQRCLTACSQRSDPSSLRSQSLCSVVMIKCRI